MIRKIKPRKPIFVGSHWGDSYRNSDGLIFRREDEYHRHWVYRSKDGAFIDTDKFRDKLANRNNLELC